MSSSTADPHPAGPGGRTGPLDPGIGTVLAWESVTQAEHSHSPLLARQCDDHASTDIDPGELLPWDAR